MTDKWATSGEGRCIAYSKGDIVITWHQSPALGFAPYWEAKHRGQRVASDNDLQKVMDYCDQFLERLS